MAGNTLGERRYYLYTDDLGNNFKFQTDEDLGSAAGNTLNDTNPDLPRRFKPRGVYVEGEVDGETVRKFLIVGTRTNGVYASNASQTVTIDGASFKTTGRKGEATSFGANPTGGGTP